MINNKVLYGEEARKALVAGVDIIATAVGSTLGPGGKNVVIDRNNEWEGPIVTKDGVTVARMIRIKDPAQKLGAQLLKQAATKTNDVAGDGPQPLYSKVLTPTGFVEMGSLKIGDTLCGTNGSIQEVLGVYPKGEKEIFKVSFEDGRVVECCEDHLWSVTTYWGKKKTLPTSSLLENGITTKTPAKTTKHHFYVKRSPVEFNSSTTLPLDPYLVGLLIGDGSLSGSGAVELALSANQENIISSIKVPAGISVSSSYNEDKHYHRVKLSGISETHYSAREYIKQIGLFGTRSATKFIPKQYLYSSVKNRQELLRGLTDTDGHINKRGLLEYSTVSKQLAEDVVELLRSLGKPVRCYLKKRSGNSYSNTSIYVVQELGGRKFGVAIESIVPTGKFTKMQCIKVSNPDHLYFTNDYILTHNTTSSTVLAQALVHEGFKHVGLGRNGVELKKGMDLAAKDAVKVLDYLSVPISLDDMASVVNVATVSGNDEEVGKLVAKAYSIVTENGLVGIQDSQSNETTIDLFEGMSYDRGYTSPYFMTDAEKEVGVMEGGVHVLIYNGMINGAKDMQTFLQAFSNKHKNENLLIISKVQGEALATMIINRIQKGFMFMTTDIPGYGPMQKDWIEDLEVLTGAKALSDESGVKFTNIDLSNLGYVSKATLGADATTLIATKDAQERITEHVKVLKEKMENCNLPMKEDQYQMRIAKLTSGVAVINIGAATASELLEKKFRYEDAVAATKAALKGGIVPGGGMALYRVQNYLANQKNTLNLSPDMQVGYDIVVKSLSSAISAIVENAGFVYGDVLGGLKNLKVQTGKKGRPTSEESQQNQINSNYGFNARTGEYVDMFAEGIIDPTIVVKQVVTNATSVAGTILTTEAVIFEDKD